MKEFRHILVLSSFFTFLLLSCSSYDEDWGQAYIGPSFSISDFKGTWNATSAVFTYSGQPPVPEISSCDVIADGGTVTMVVQSNGSYTLTVARALLGAETFSGTMHYEDGELFAIQFDDDSLNDPNYFEGTLSNSTFTLYGGPNTAEWDIDGDGDDDPCSVFLSFSFNRNRL